MTDLAKLRKPALWVVERFSGKRWEITGWAEYTRKEARRQLNTIRQQFKHNDYRLRKYERVGK